MTKYQVFKKSFRQSIKDVADYYESRRYSSESQFEDWLLAIQEFDVFVRSLDNTETMIWMQNCKLTDGILFGDWFVNAPEELKTGFIRSFISLNVWKYTDDFDDYIRNGYMPIVMGGFESAYMSTPSDFRMFLDSDYFYSESLDSILRHALSKGNGNIIDHSCSYINSNNDIVFVSQPYSNAIRMSLSDMRTFINRFLHFYKAQVSIQLSDMSEYSDGCVTLMFIISFS